MSKVTVGGNRVSWKDISVCSNISENTIAYGVPAIVVKKG